MLNLHLSEHMHKMSIPGYNLFYSGAKSRLTACVPDFNECGKSHFLPSKLLFDIMEEYKFLGNSKALFAHLVAITRSTS